VTNFFKFPKGMIAGEASAVAVNTKGHIFLFQRTKPMLAEYDEKGNFVQSIGEGLFSHPHGLRIDADGKASRAANVQRLSSRKKDAGNQVGIIITNFTCFVRSARQRTTLKKRSGLWNSHRRYFDDRLKKATSFRGHQNGHQKA
jgi:hypothetical protein